MNVHLGQSRQKPPLAAAYVRVSTDLQKYSLDFQQRAISEYAERHRLDIVRTYMDEGKSGLQLKGRDALQMLIADVCSGDPGFQTLLVYDVSRWGRFQDADESAHLEFICRRAGVAVEYVAEQFSNDGSPFATIMKSVKRAMAGEYSRELSEKVFQGMCASVRAGHIQGGRAPYGLRRMVTDVQGRRRGELGDGQRKLAQTDRVILVPGPKREIRIVRKIFRLFVEDRLTLAAIARWLDEHGHMTGARVRWTPSTIRRLLKNEKYVGDNVFNKTSCKLKGREVANPPEDWIRMEGVFKPIVAKELFDRAQAEFARRRRFPEKDEILAKLREIHRTRGKVTRVLIDQTPGLPKHGMLIKVFGSLCAAYDEIGYRPSSILRTQAMTRKCRETRHDVAMSIVNHVTRSGGRASSDRKSRTVTIDGGFAVLILVACSHWKRSGQLVWHLKMVKHSPADMAIVVRLDGQNDQAFDYHILPTRSLKGTVKWISEANGFGWDAHRCERLDDLLHMLGTAPIEEALP